MSSRFILIIRLRLECHAAARETDGNPVAQASARAIGQCASTIHFAAFKKHIGLYPGGEATSKFAERLVGYKTSKGAIQLPLGKPIDYELITDIVRWRVNQEAKGSDTL